MTTQAAAEPVLGFKRGAGWFLTAGILFIAIGALALVEPLITSLAVGVFLGVSFMFAGVMAVATGIVNLRHKGSWLFLLLGLLGLLAGGFMAIRPLAAAVSLVWVIGFFLMLAGVFELVAAFRAEKHRAWMIILGTVDILLGVLLVDIDPISAVQFLAFIVAISFFMRGVASIVWANVLRKAAKG